MLSCVCGPVGWQLHVPKTDKTGYAEVTRLIKRVTSVTIWVVGVITLLAQFPDPPSNSLYIGLDRGKLEGLGAG